MNYDYMVSVRLMTYNHEAYINQAIEGILMQLTNFNVELVVGDDFSSDNTLALIKKYKSTENIEIKILERPKGGDYWTKRMREGRFYNFTNILENCSGKYIALLDGDDYWTDPLKLQKQVDFLEANQQYSLCFTNRINYNQSLDRFMPSKPVQQFDFSLVDYLNKVQNGIISATATSMFRARVLNMIDLNEFLRYCKKSMAADTFLFSVILTKGRGKILKDETTVYRITGKGISSKFTMPIRYKIRITTLQFLLNKNLVTDVPDRTYIKKRLNELKYNYIKNKFLTFTNKIGFNSVYKKIVKK